MLILTGVSARTCSPAWPRPLTVTGPPGWKRAAASGGWYKDRQARTREGAGDRLAPLPVMPAWDVAACVAEARRVAGLGASGVNMPSDPQDLGCPDLASRGGDPFWETCAGLRLPV